MHEDGVMKTDYGEKKVALSPTRIRADGDDSVHLARGGAM
jgi:hypothetical protein